MSIFTARISQLQDLVEAPVEREWLELKSWVDLTENVMRANCARHLAAIVNYGGGYLIFGFEDDGTRCARKADVSTAYSRDVLAGVVARYLQPRFQCEVSFVEAEGVEHPVVWVPSHGASPIISRADGPQEKGVPQGIRAGVVYIRTPKPESEPATKPEHWEKIIRRCVVAGRDELLGQFSIIMSGPKEPAAETARKRLEAWHTAAQRAARVAASVARAKLRYPLAESFVQFSYLIRHRDGESVSAKCGFPLIQKLNAAVRDTVRYGRSMFYLYTRPEISPRFERDAAIDGGDTDFLQASTFEAAVNRGEFWRIGLDGRASILRPFDEDLFERPPSVPKGSESFDPRIQIRDIMEVVRHARAFAEEFNEVTDVCFQLEWLGLKGRLPATHELYQEQSYTAASTDSRKHYECVPFALVAGDAPEVVSRLFAPVYRLFNPRGEISAEYVRRYMDSFIEPGT
jgi:Putative DNA-binding domain